MMNIQLLDRTKAASELKKYFEGLADFTKLNSDYTKIRKEICQLFNQTVKYKTIETPRIDEYKTDLNFAIKVYEYFNAQDWFNESLASNYEFWTYICVKVVPDIIEKRHGRQIEYYYEKSVRMYIPTMWWYIHMSYQGDVDKTIETLKNLNTDYILQLVERPGKDGMHLVISRTIMKYIGQLPKEVLEEKIDKKNLIRRVLIQNTSKINNFNLVFDGKEDLYVKELFSTCGVTVK